MNVKKAVKRIAALAAGTTMVTATMMGAMAADLSDYPEPFVKNGVYNGKIVLGQQAPAADVLGAIDIAASLQAAAKTSVNVDGVAGTISVTGGVEIKSSSEDFNIGDSLDDFNQGEYDADDFPELLADGTVEDDDGTEYDYDQKITLGDATLKYGQTDDYGDEPVFYLDLTSGSTDYIQFTVEFDDALDIAEDSSDGTGLTDSESIEMFGKTYTFDPNHQTGDDVTLYGSDVTINVGKDEPVTVEVNGDEYTIEVLGGTDAGVANVRVTGAGTSTKSLTAGDSVKMAGLDLFVDDVFVSTIGGEDISVSIFVGSEKIEIPSNAVSAASAFQEITIGTEDETEIYAWVEGADLDAVDAIHFRINPSDFIDENINDEYDWLVMGEEFVDPLFGFKLSFTGMMPSVEGRDVVELVRVGDAYNFKAMNNDGDEYDVEVFTSDGTDLSVGDDIVYFDSSPAEDKLFILESTDAKVGEKTSYIFEVRDIDTTDLEVQLKELGSGSTVTYENGDQIEDTGVYAQVYGGAFELRNSANDTSIVSKDRFVAKGGLLVDFINQSSVAQMTGNDTVTVTFLEDSDDMDEATADTLMVTITPDSTDDIKQGSPSGFPAANEATDSDGDYRFGISAYGTWYEQEADDNGDYLKVYYSPVETDFNVLLNGPDAVVVTSGSSDGGSAYQLNELVVGQIAIFDNEASSLVGRTPLIVVGGPCANTVAMNLMGNPENCAEGFTDGRAIIKFYDSQNAILVAGYSAEDTIGASYVLADYNNYDLEGDEVEVIVTDLENLEVNSVA